MQKDIKDVIAIILQDFPPEFKTAYYKYVTDNGIQENDPVFRFFLGNGIFTSVIQKSVAESVKAADQIKLNTNESISKLDASSSRQTAELRQIIAEFPKKIENSIKSLELLLKTHNFPQIESSSQGGQSTLSIRQSSNLIDFRAIDGSI